jgi:subtilisin family serine protease
MKITKRTSSRGFREIAALLIAVGALSASLVLVGAEQTDQGPQKPKYPDISQGIGKTRGGEATEKLAPELRILFGQYNQTRGGDRQQVKFNQEQLQSLFGIQDPSSSNPTVNIAVQLTANGTLDELKRNGAKVYLRSGDTVVLARSSVLSLERIARGQSVLSVKTNAAVATPPIPKSNRPPSLEGIGRGGGAVGLDNEFNSQQLTGKGVIIGVVDTGIDWRHADFIKPDGTSRILYLWDQIDDSFQTSGGKIGTAPPVLQQGADAGPGTVYTNAQINAALKNRGTVNSMDNFGHGTTSAGTAAGNGRATTPGVPIGTYRGVAPEADLIIVKAADCGGFEATYILGTYWIQQVAKSRNQPVVINHSLGGQYTAHDGTDPAEVLMNSLTGAGKPGVAITVSAGNEGLYSLHATGRFGPRVPGQEDVDGSTIEVNVSAKRAEDLTFINGYFNADEDWGLGIVGSDHFLVDENGKPFAAFVFKVGNDLKVNLSRDVKKPKYFDSFANNILQASELAKPGGKHDKIAIPLPAGSYYLWGFGPTANVKRGSFDLYVPSYSEGGFTIGAQKNMMVGSPGNATNVITVGSYDFRQDWINSEGKQTRYNLGLKGVSDYSSPGGLREDGVFKPDITAPARYTISSMSAAASPGSTTCEGNNMGAAGKAAVTQDGMHLAWSGTSAAAPFTAGVIALMLQKNPNLDGKQIRDILTSTAVKGDRFVGAVPNPEWGFGKLNPVAAIAAVPVAGGRPVGRPRS